MSRNQLAREAKACVDRIVSQGIDLQQNWDFAWTQIAVRLGQRFAVSAAVIEKRLEKDRVKRRFKS